jgi:hypothetical protein
MNLIGKLAQKIVDKQKAKDESKKKENENIWANAQADYQYKLAFLKSFEEKYVKEVEADFVEKIQPKFSVGEKVLTNWFGPRDSWEGSVCMLQEHTPYKGPIEVEITKVVLDASYLSEKIYNMIEHGDFDEVKAPYKYDLFESIANDKISKDDYPVISWAYVIKVPSDEKVYWTYSWREVKLLKLDSEEAKLSIKAWKKTIEKIKAQEKYAKLQVEVHDAEMEIEKFINSLNE